MSAFHDESAVATGARVPRLQTFAIGVVGAIRTHLRPIRASNHALTLSAKRDQPNVPSIRCFLSQGKALCAIQLGPAGFPAADQLQARF